MGIELTTDRRGLSPVVEKTLVAGISLLFIGGMLGLLMGGIVPGYQATAGEELGERTLATAAGNIEATASTVDGDVHRTTSVTLPPTIRNEQYELVLENTKLRLESRRMSFDQTIHLAVPETVSIIESSWRSGGTLRIHLEGPPGNRTLWIGER